MGCDKIPTYCADPEVEFWTRAYTSDLPQYKTMGSWQSPSCTHWLSVGCGVSRNMEMDKKDKKIWLEHQHHLPPCGWEGVGRVENQEK